MMARLPSLFVSHGAPTFAIEPGLAGPKLTALGQALPRPRAVLVVSPHWMTPSPRVGLVARPPTIHDFGGFDPALYRDKDFYESVGCADCGFSGYHGRTAIAEVLDLSDPIREMILIRKPLSEVRKTAKAEGMTSIRDVGMGKVLAGLTSLKELNKVTFVE